MPIDPLFWVGPVGGLHSLPDRLVDVTATRTVLGGAHTGMGDRVNGPGVATVDSYGRKGAWAWSWEMLLPHQTVLVDALTEGTVPGPLRLIDPRRANRLPPQVASGGSVRSSPSGFDPTVGTRRFARFDTIPAGTAGLTPAPVLKGGVRWTLPAGGGRLFPSWPGPLGRWLLPLLPGEQIQLTAWVCVSAAVDVRLAWPEHRRTGVVDVAGRARTVTPGRWQRVRATLTPSATALTPMLEVDASAPEVTVWTTAWSASAAGAEDVPASVTTLCDTDDIADGWRPGGGAPHVQVAGDAARGYGLPWAHKAALTLVEV